MAIDSQIPDMTDASLATLRSNALRLKEDGTPKQQADAERVLPLIEAELAERKRNAPPRKRPATPTKKAAAKPTRRSAKT